MDSSMDNLDSESGGFNTFEFSDKSIRQGFIRKVYLILMSQLVVTCGVIAIFVTSDSVKDWCGNNQWLWIVCFIGTFVCIIVLACCETVRRTFPKNFIFLGLFTFLEAILLGLVSATYEAWEVLLAVGITAIVAFALTIFALQTKYDFTMCSGGLLALLVCLLIFGIFAAIFPSKVVNIVYATLGALIFSMYLVFDTQLMVGGKHKYALSPEEYVFAALNLYLDLINLFLFILSIIGNSRN